MAPIPPYDAYKVTAYTIWNTRHEFQVHTHDLAMEYAKRMITEGLWVVDEEDNDTFFPADKLAKVKITRT